MPACEIIGCCITATYGYTKYKGLRCLEHRNTDMIDVISRRCLSEGCKCQPIFGLKGKKPGYCLQHKTACMIDLKNKKCAADACEKQPSYDIKGGKGVFCVTHKLDGMVDVRHHSCIHVDCIVRPTYGFLTEKATRCFEHKLEGMCLRVKHTPCNYDGCTVKHAKYDISGGEGRFCNEHKLADMISVKNTRKCNFAGCNIRACYNNLPSAVGEFCKKHALDGMVDVTSTMCDATGCRKQPTFIDPVSHKNFCGTHKPTSAIKNGRVNLCSAEGCKITARFNKAGEKRGVFCFSHKLDGMIDVHIIRCDECLTTASYGIPGTKQTHCARHRQPGMIQRSSHNCRIAACKEPAVFGTIRAALRCSKHKLESDINLVERQCKSCKMIMILDKDNVCEYCNPLTFNAVRLQKQDAILSYLDSCTFLPKGSSTDKIIDSACGKERPDRTYELADKVIIVECDEHQHRDRDPLCESVRMKNIGQTYGGLPVYFIRWNPDTYLSFNPSKLQDELRIRNKLLSALIKDIIEDTVILPTCLVAVIYLYYDGWNGLAAQQWNILTAFD
jgi:hypothetical protein